MGRPLKIVKLGLEELALQGRRDSKTPEEIALELVQALLDRGDDAAAAAGISESAVKRYFASLDARAVPAVHEPKLAAENANLANGLEARFARLDELLSTWIEEAHVAVTPMRGVRWNPYTQQPDNPKDAYEDASRLDALIEQELGDAWELVSDPMRRRLREMAAPVQVMVPDWQARTSVSRELREYLKAITDLMERVYDAQQVKLFQETVLAEIESVEPDSAARIVGALQRVQQIRRAALLGATPPSPKEGSPP